MKVTIVDRKEEADARGTVVVLDVIRAFTTASAAFAGGVERMICVREVSHAVELGAANPDWLVIGEDGDKPEAFHCDNSPTEVARHQLAGRTAVFRTTNGTRGLAAAEHATTILAAAASNVGATARWVLANRPNDPVTIVCTDTKRDEDPAVAEYLAALLSGSSPDPEVTAHRIYRGAAGHMKAWGLRASEEFLAGFLRDANACASLDSHDLVMLGSRQSDGSVVLVSA